MDPTSCYHLILDYLATHDYVEATTYARILQNWLAHRGFYPEGYSPENVDALLNELLKPACASNAMEMRFQSLSCYHCDAGQHIASLPQAIDEGWIEIMGDEELTVTSHLGTCPTCRMAQDSSP